MLIALGSFTALDALPRGSTEGATKEAILAGAKEYAGEECLVDDATWDAAWQAAIARPEEGGLFAETATPKHYGHADTYGKRPTAR